MDILMVGMSRMVTAIAKRANAMAIHIMEKTHIIRVIIIELPMGVPTHK